MDIFKQRYPFRLATTSFIYPAGYIPNIRRLGPFFDEVELLFFESRDEALPSPADIARMRDLACELDITYNVHLPLDLDLGGPDANDGLQAARRFAAALELVRPLSATTHTLHLVFSGNDTSPAAVAAWQARTRKNLEKLMDASPVPSRKISVETLAYPSRWFAPIVEEFDLSVCVDIGHIIRYGYDLEQVLSDYSPRVTILHLHGVENGKDHRSVSAIGLDRWRPIVPFLKSFKGTVSLELFSLPDLEDSLAAFGPRMAADDDGFDR